MIRFLIDPEALPELGPEKTRVEIFTTDSVSSSYASAGTGRFSTAYHLIALKLEDRDLDWRADRITISSNRTTRPHTDTTTIEPDTLVALLAIRPDGPDGCWFELEGERIEPDHGEVIVFDPAREHCAHTQGRAVNAAFWRAKR